jgi:hypothetical protein
MNKRCMMPVIEIATPSGPRWEVILDNCGEMVVTFSTAETALDFGYYTLTHVRTGYAIVSDDSRESLKILAEILRPLDWSSDDPDVVRQLGPKVKPLLAQWRAQRSYERALIVAMLAAACGWILFLIR